jgi:hypothetical protein
LVERRSAKMSRGRLIAAIRLIMPADAALFCLVYPFTEFLALSLAGYDNCKPQNAKKSYVFSHTPIKSNRESYNGDKD